jgi:hypothetical protein
MKSSRASAKPPILRGGRYLALRRHGRLKQPKRSEVDGVYGWRLAAGEEM